MERCHEDTTSHALSILDMKSNSTKNMAYLGFPTEEMRSPGARAGASAGALAGLQGST